MKDQIIAFLTEPENFNLQSVSDAVYYFDLCQLEEQDCVNELEKKLESLFCIREEVEAKDWIATEDMEMFEKFCRE